MNPQKLFLINVGVEILRKSKWIQELKELKRKCVKKQEINSRNYKTVRKQELLYVISLNREILYANGAETGTPGGLSRSSCT